MDEGLCGGREDMCWWKKEGSMWVGGGNEEDYEKMGEGCGRVGK